MVALWLLACGVADRSDSADTGAGGPDCEPVECPPPEFTGAYTYQHEEDCRRCTEDDLTWYACLMREQPWESPREADPDDADVAFEYVCIFGPPPP